MRSEAGVVCGLDCGKERRMEVIHLKAGEIVAKRKDKVSAWYIVQEGNVTLRHEFEETTLGPNAIIGILE